MLIAVTMARPDPLTTTLYAVQGAVIACGAIASAVLLVQSCRARSVHGHDAAAPALAARSACRGGAGTLAMLRAYLDGAELPGEPSTRPPVVDGELRARGAALYAEHCATCHGTRGDGRGPTAAQLVHPPADFTIGTYELRTTEHEALPIDVDLFRTMSRGVHGTAMPPWLGLPERDRWALVAHLKTLSTAFSDDEPPAPVEAVAPTATPDRIRHGRQVYESAGCASCHGDGGRGDGPAASSLSYKSGAPARPRDLRMGRFHRTTRLADIFLTITTGLDGTPMASFAKLLPPDSRWDVAFYVHELVPPIVDAAGGIRCPEIPSELRCVELPTGLACPDQLVPPDEVVGIRTELQSLSTR